MSTGGGGTESVTVTDSASNPPANSAKEGVDEVNGSSTNDRKADNDKEVAEGGVAPNEKESADVDRSSPPPQSQSNSYQQAGFYHQHVTPQPGYYSYQNQQVTPEPPSPTAPSGGYDIAAFLQQQAALAQHQAAVGAPFGASPQYTGIPQPPLSPSQTSTSNAGANISMGIVPPASPLFPAAAPAAFPGGALDQQHRQDASAMSRISSTGAGAAPPSPSLPYLSSPPLGPTANASGVSSYSAYPGYGAGGSGGYGSLNGRGSSSSTSPEQSTWAERAIPQQPLYPQSTASPSPQLQPQAIPVQYQTGIARSNSNHRSYSFDEMLPPSAYDQQDQSPGGYYGASQASSGAGGGGTLFAHQQPWGYGGASDAYSGSHGHQRQHPHGHHQIHGHGGHHGGGGGHHPPRHAGQPSPGQLGGMPYYTATTPGPPIQTTASNKGPDGANLFIFHIPNHFTNLDMYHLFCHYGTLLSVRIMVEKDTGRSRGFGFVSYDSPEAAAMAIKELNGFVIGNKRLKVQHKQIRASDHSTGQQHHHHQTPSYSMPSTNDAGFIRGDVRSSDSASPPAGGGPSSLNAAQWYETQHRHEAPSGGKNDPGNGAGNEDTPVLPELPDVNKDVATSNALASKARPGGEAALQLGETAKGLDIGGGVGLDEAGSENVGVSGVTGDGSSTVSPLTQFDEIRKALPEVSD